jgi:hypothetical protein
VAGLAPVRRGVRRKEKETMTKAYGRLLILVSSVLITGCGTIGSLANRHRHVQIEFQLIEVENDAVAAISPKSQLTATSVLDLIRNGKARLAQTVAVMTLNGVQATVKGVREFIYPTDFFMHGAEGKQTLTVTATTGAVVEPGNFEMREVGVILTVLPNIRGAGAISLVMTPERIYEPEWQVYSLLDNADNANPTNATIKQPLFNTCSLSTEVLLKNNEPTLLSACPMVGSDKTIVMVVCGRILD